MVNFPTELPLEAVRQVIKFARRDDTDLGRAALAAWNVLGYAGHLSFGAPVFLIGATGDDDFDINSLSGMSMEDILNDVKLKGMIPPWLISLGIQVVLRFLQRRLNK